MVDAVLVMVPLLVLFLGIVQVGLLLHTRTLLVAAAQEGARYAANADVSLAAGEQRTRDVLAEGLSEAVARRTSVAARPLSRDGLQVVEVTVRGRLPLRLLPGAPVELTVRGHALEESR